LSDPGGICISGAAFDQLKAQVDVGYAELGEQRVKNIHMPVRAYKVLLDADAAGRFIARTRTSARRWRIPAFAAALVVVTAAGALAWWQLWLTPDDQALPPPVNPSVAVLPFTNLTNLSGDTFAEVVQRDISDKLATTLSRLPDMFVIAWQPDNPDRDTADEVRQAAKDLGVIYALEGSVRRSGATVRITAKLFDASTERDLWGESYNGELRDVSDIQDDITQDAVAALKANFAEDARERIVRGNTNNSEAYSLVRRGIPLLEGGTREEIAEAQDLFQKAVKADPRYLIGWHLLSYTYSASSRTGWAEHPEQERADAEALAQKALAVNPSAAGPYILLSTIARLRGLYNEPLRIWGRPWCFPAEQDSRKKHLLCSSGPSDLVRTRRPRYYSTRASLTARWADTNRRCRCLNKSVRQIRKGKVCLPFLR
jgi:adenylate cyclase